MKGTDWVQSLFDPYHLVEIHIFKKYLKVNQLSTGRITIHFYPLLTQAKYTTAVIPIKPGGRSSAHNVQRKLVTF